MTVYYKEFHSPVREVAYKQVTSEVGKLFFSKDLVKIAVFKHTGHLQNQSYFYNNTKMLFAFLIVLIFAWRV